MIQLWIETIEHQKKKKRKRKLVEHLCWRSIFIAIDARMQNIKTSMVLRQPILFRRMFPYMLIHILFTYPLKIWLNRYSSESWVQKVTQSKHFLLNSHHSPYACIFQRIYEQDSTANFNILSFSIKLLNTTWKITSHDRKSIILKILFSVTKHSTWHTGKWQNYQLH